MSLLDTIIGSSSRATSQNTADQTQTQSQVKNTTQNTSAVTNNNQNQSSSGSTTSGSTTAQKNQSSAAGKSSSNSLDQGVVDLVSNLIGSLAGGNGQVSDIVSMLMQKANKPAVSDEDIAGKQSAAVTNFGNNQAVDIGRVTQAIGSTGNTYAAQLAEKGNTDLTAILAGITADAHLANETLSTQQLMDALQGSSINATQIANLVGSLKGANTTTTSDQSINGTTSQETAAQTAQQIMEILTGKNEATQTSNTAEEDFGTIDVNSSSYTKGKQGSGLLGFL